MQEFFILWAVSSVTCFFLYLMDYMYRDSITVREILVHICLTFLPTSIIVVLVVFIFGVIECVPSIFTNISRFLDREVKLNSK